MLGDHHQIVAWIRVGDFGSIRVEIVVITWIDRVQSSIRIGYVLPIRANQKLSWNQPIFCFLRRTVHIPP